LSNPGGGGKKTLQFSLIGGGNSNPVPEVAAPYDDADIYANDGSAFSRAVDASVALGLPGNADVDGLHVIDSDTFYLSFNLDSGTVVPGLGTVQDEDVVLYDAGAWSLFFDGSVCGLDAVNGQDVDAIHVEGGVLFFSTLGGGNRNPVAGVAKPYDDADIYTWNQGARSCGRSFDASQNGLPSAADIDGLTSKSGILYMSFNRNGGTSVPGLGSIQDEAVVSYDGGTWSLYFAGAGLDGSNGQDVDAIHVP
jgi:hypothetical protein